ncbi:unnamed protein product, partial [Prorocentrum cordatum]
VFMVRVLFAAWALMPKGDLWLNLRTRELDCSVRLGYRELLDGTALLMAKQFPRPQKYTRVHRLPEKH